MAQHVRNWRLILTVSAIGIVLFFAIAVIFIGYIAATGNAFGHFAPIGQPVNVKHP